MSPPTESDFFVWGSYLFLFFVMPSHSQDPVAIVLEREAH